MMAMLAERALVDPDPHELARSAAAMSTIEKRKITRNRTSYSCQKCRLRKIKCDKQHPKCGTCVKTNDECVYGKSESEASNAQNGASGASGSTAKRRRSLVTTGIESPPRSQGSSIEHPKLDVLELQLNRLSSMIERMRRNSDTSPYHFPDPVTPISREEEQRSSQSSSRSPGQPPAASIDEHPLLTKPLSELNINNFDGAINEPVLPYWASLVEEVEQLHTMMQGIRPLGPLPHADTTQVGCPGYAYPTQQKEASSRPKSTSEQLSFRKMAKVDHIGTTNSECNTCFENACDKSMLLPGCTSARLATLTKLDLTAGIPTEAQSYVLFRACLTSVYPVLPFMSIYHAFKKHQGFWSWKNNLNDSQINNPDSADLYFMPLLYSIWYSGALGLSARGFKKWFPDKTRAEMAAHFHDQIIRYLSLVSFPSNLQVPLLGCLILIQSVPASEEEPVQGSTFINLMVKLAQTAGIHREPALFGVAPHEAEIRRRMWWQIVQLDSNFASGNGYPTFVDDNTADTRPISEVYEAYVGSPEERQYLPDAIQGSEQRDVLPEPLSGASSVVSAFPLVVKGLHKAALAIRKAANMHVSTKLVDKHAIQLINTTINDAEAEIRDTIRRLPTKGVPELGFAPDTSATSDWPLLECDTSFGEPITEAEYAHCFGKPNSQRMPSKLAQYHRQKLFAFNKWARISLSAMCDRMYLVTYAPFLKNSKSRVWTSGRQCALHHGTSFLRKFISLATDPSLESFRWNWPGPLHPMHAAMVLLVDLYERPHSVEAPRCRALIDKVFSLSDPANGIIGGENGVSTQRPLREGGSEAWDLLRDLRISGWKKAGLDPAVLWTEQDQILMGIAEPLTPDQKIMQSLREDLLEPEDELGAFPQPQAVGSYSGLCYALQTVQGEMVDGKQVHSEPATMFGRNSRQLFKLSTQQAMPYPLQDFEHRGCPGLHHHSDDDHREAAEAEAFRALQVMQRAEAPGGPGGESGVLAPDSSNHFNGKGRQTKGVYIPGQLNEEDGLGSGNRGNFPSDTSSRPGELLSSNGVTQQGESTAARYDDMDTDGLSGGFDWERWDAVFGQYSGFTDLMEIDADDWEPQ